LIIGMQHSMPVEHSEPASAAVLHGMDGAAPSSVTLASPASPALLLLLDEPHATASATAIDVPKPILAYRMSHSSTFRLPV
jgi:hypothetical protein